MGRGPGSSGVRAGVVQRARVRGWGEAVYVHAGGSNRATHLWAPGPATRDPPRAGEESRTALEGGIMAISSPACVHGLMSHQMRVQTPPYRARIAVICGALWGVVVSKHSTPGSSNCRGARCGCTLLPDLEPASLALCAHPHAQPTP